MARSDDPRPHLLASGCLGGIAVAAAASWLRFLVERTPALDTHTAPHLVASGLAGVGLLAMGICAWRLAPNARHLSWRALGTWALAVQLVAALALPLTSTDAFSYLAQGALARTGLSPYRHGPADLGASPLLVAVPDRWLHAPTPYGPAFVRLSAIAVAAGQRLGSPLWGSLLAYKAVILTALLGALGVAAWFLHRRAKDGRDVFVLLALGPLLPWEIAAQGHNDGLVVLAAVGFFAAAAAGRDRLAAAILAVGISAKFVLAPLLALHVLLVARRSPRRAVGAAALALVVLGAAYAPAWGELTLHDLGVLLGVSEVRHAHSLADLAWLAFDGVGSPRAAAASYRVLGIAAGLALGAALVYAAWKARTLEGVAHGYLVVLFTTYLTAVSFQPWYVAWALPLLLVEPDPRWRRLLGLFAIVTVVQWGLPLDPLTTVIADAWAATRAWRLLREPQAVALAEPA